MCLEEVLCIEQQGIAHVVSAVCERYCLLLNGPRFGVA